MTIVAPGRIRDNTLMSDTSAIFEHPKPLLRGFPHLIAVIAAVPAVALLVAHARADAVVASVVYGAALVALLGVSALYHTPNWSLNLRMVLRRVDHSMIYALIAGSYTPLCLALGGDAAQILLPLVWTAAALGTVQSILWPRAPRWITAGLYVLLGWAIVPYLPSLHTALGPLPFGLIGLGGLMYTIGAVAYARKWPDPAPRVFGYHEIFHVLVVVAAACHFAAIWVTVGTAA